ncbi:MAG: Y-family DNA polymerase [Rikenellaceae bacterium]
MIGLCDCNNFFVSCERVFNPSLEGCAVVVLSSNDGCVIARSNESKALGIKMGQPIFQVQHLVRSGQLKILSTNHTLYGDMSQRVMSTLREATPSIEVYSIDEAFLDFSGFQIESMQEYGRQLARKVRRNTGIPVSIGIAPTKTLAKVASKLCKKYPKLQGCCVMYRPEDVAKVLSSYPIEDVWGIGRRSTKLLNAHGVRTAEDFRRMPQRWVQSQMGIVGVRTWQELHGKSCLEFGYTTPDRQSIMVSRSFAKEIYEFDKLHEAVATFASQASEKLRGQRSVAMQVQLFVATNRHREDHPQHNEGRLARFSTATDSTLDIVQSATLLLKEIFKEGFGYKKAGVVLTDISSAEGIQASIFDVDHRAKHRSLMEAMDKINTTHGASMVRVGSQREGHIPTKSQHRSPRYTTEWSDILTIKV